MSCDCCSLRPPPNCAGCAWATGAQGFSRGRGSSNRPEEGSLLEVRVVTYGRPGPRRLAPARDPELEGTVLSGLCAAPSVPKPSLEPLSGPLAHPVTTCVSSARRSLVMAAVEQPVPVLSIVDPDGRLHEVPRRIFNVWCKEMGITRADNLSRACKTAAWPDGTSQMRPLTSMAPGSHSTSWSSCSRLTR